jgi:hypothetical protein
VRTKLFVPPLYAVRVFVAVGETTGEELFKLVLSRFGIAMPNLKKEVESCAGSCNMKGELCVLWLRDMRGDDAIDTLTHEVLHAVTAILKYSGLRFSAASEEAYAYLTGWLNGAIWKWAKKRKTRTNA